MRQTILLGAALFSLLGPAAIAGDQQGVPLRTDAGWRSVPSACIKEPAPPVVSDAPAEIADADAICPAIDPPPALAKKPLLRRVIDQFTSGHRIDGLASYYSARFDGRKTASGEVFRNSKFSAAHLTLPLGTWVEVRSRATGRKLRLKVNDRGPFVKKFVLDLSQAAARFLGVDSARDRYVEIRVIALPGETPPPEEPEEAPAEPAPDTTIASNAGAGR